MSQNLQGMLLMTASMALLSIGDSAVKILSGYYSPWIIIFAMGSCAVIIFGLVAWWTGRSLIDRRAFGRAALFRSLMEIAAALTMVVALSRAPFTLITLILQAMPLMVTIGAVFAFGEIVGFRRWAAILVGFVGVLLIIQPGAVGANEGWLFAILAALALSARDLASRSVPREITTAQIAGWGGMAMAIGGLAAHLLSGNSWPEVRTGDALPFLILVVCLAIGVFAVSAAMRIGDVSVVAPFRYTRLPFGLLIGVLFFGEALTTNMIVGAIIVVASGFYIWWREIRVAETAQL